MTPSPRQAPGRSRVQVPPRPDPQRKARGVGKLVDFPGGTSRSGLYLCDPCPVSGDAIVGYISLGDGITIHQDGIARLGP